MLLVAPLGLALGHAAVDRVAVWQLLAPHQRKQKADVIGVLSIILQLIESGPTNSGVATDHVIKSFRNDLWLGYKPSKGMEPQILRQIPVLEDALTAMGVIEFEAAVAESSV